MEDTINETEETNSSPDMPERKSENETTQHPSVATENGKIVDTGIVYVNPANEKTEIPQNGNIIVNENGKSTVNPSVFGNSNDTRNRCDETDTVGESHQEAEKQNDADIKVNSKSEGTQDSRFPEDQSTENEDNETEKKEDSVMEVCYCINFIVSVQIKTILLIILLLLLLLLKPSNYETKVLFVSNLKKTAILKNLMMFKI